MTSKLDIDALFPGMPEVAGKRILDVGCGEGAQLRQLAAAGATGVGLDCSARQLEKARAAPLQADETYVDGVAEDMPFADGFFDIVMLYNSLHHVPVEHMAEALAEAARVVAPNGLVYVSEPLAEGPHFELQKQLEDETAVRAAATRALEDAAASRLAEERQFVYPRRVRLESFEAFAERVTTILPHCKDTFAANQDDLRADFQRLGEAADGGFEFVQPTRVNLLRRGGGGG